MLTRAQLNTLFDALPPTPGVVYHGAFVTRLPDYEFRLWLRDRFEALDDEDRRHVARMYAELEAEGERATA